MRWSDCALSSYADVQPAMPYLKEVSMSWRIDAKVADTLQKANDNNLLTQEEISGLLRLDLDSIEVYAIAHTANALSRRDFGQKGENHFHIGLNVAPCSYNCKFCSLTKGAGLFKESVEFSEDRLLDWARAGQKQGADALNLMTTGQFSFERLLEIGKLLKSSVRVPLVANTRDVNHNEAEALLEAGFVGFYHAVRLREGIDTPFSVEKRINTVKVLRDVGLRWMNCIEPVGPEHTPEEIADLMALARKYGATYSGVMRRINFPGSPCSKEGMITEREMGRMVAVSRLVMGATPLAHCTHEPNTIALMSGANLLFPEVGSSPRDAMSDTGEGRGRALPQCKSLFRETGWDPDLRSNCFPELEQNTDETYCGSNR